MTHPYQRLFGHPVGDASWPVLVLLLLAGILLLSFGAHWLVDGGAKLAQRWGMSAMVVGLTIVAWGTSAPEVVVSGMAAARGSVASALGNVLGSNIANIGLVLGVCAVVLPRVLDGKLPRREFLWLVGSLGTLWVSALDHVVSRLEGGALLAVFAVHSWQVWYTQRDAPDGFEEPRARHPLVSVLLGSLAITVGAWLVLDSGQAAAVRVGIDELVVGLAVLAVGTSLPELAAGLRASLRGEAEIGIGNVVGSNVFNVLAVIGIAAVVHPFRADPADPAAAAALDAAFRDALAYDFPAVLVFSLTAVGLKYVGDAGSARWKGAVLLALYGAYWGLRPVVLEG